MENNEQTPFVPFTKAERIQQLGEIDRNIVNLLKSTAQAIQSLGKRETQGEDAAMTDDSQKQVFKDSMDDFLATLRVVNVGIKRQIWGLEEEHIISLPKKDIQNIKEENGEVQVSHIRSGLLEPDGDGKIGGLDVGFLNSQSNKVERDMEADMWNEAEAIMRRLLAHGCQNPGTDSGLPAS